MYKECGNNFCLVGHGKLAAALRGSRAKSEEILEGSQNFPPPAGMMEHLMNKMITVKGSPQASAYARMQTHAATKDGESSLRSRSSDQPHSSETRSHYTFSPLVSVSSQILHPVLLFLPFFQT